MANDITALMHEMILPAAAKRLRGELTMPQLIHNDVEDVAQQVGDEISIAAPVYFAEGADFKDADSNTVSSAFKADKVKIKLDVQPYKQWEMSDREFMSHASSNTLPSAMEAAVDAIAEAINEQCLGLYRQITNVSGTTVGTGVDKTKNDILEARLVLQRNKVRKGRTLVLCDDTEGTLLSEFSNLAETGDKDAIVEGLIGRKFGFDIYSDIQAPLHTAGNGAGNTGVTVVSAVAGGKTLVLAGFDAVEPTLNAGDVIEMADGTRYSVAADAIGAGNELSVSVYQVVKGHGAGEAVAIPMGTATHGVDLGFHKSFAAIAFRKLKPAGNAPGVTIAEMADPVTGIPLRLMSWYDPASEKTVWKLSTLFGLTIVDASRAVRLGERID